MPVEQERRMLCDVQTVYREHMRWKVWTWHGTTKACSFAASAEGIAKRRRWWTDYWQRQLSIRYTSVEEIRNTIMLQSRLRFFGTLFSHMVATFLENLEMSKMSRTLTGNVRGKSFEGKLSVVWSLYLKDFSAYFEHFCRYVYSVLVAQPKYMLEVGKATSVGVLWRVESESGHPTVKAWSLVFVWSTASSGSRSSFLGKNWEVLYQYDAVFSQCVAL